MATTYEFGPFRLDADAEILFRGAEPIVLGQRAVALLRLLLERAGSARFQGCAVRGRVAGTGRRGQQSDSPDRGLAPGVRRSRRRRGLDRDVAAPWLSLCRPAVATARAAAVAPRPASPLALPDKPSVAVLPFTNLSGDPEQEYFADGMVEDIIAGLSRIKWLFVIARNSSFAYKGKRHRREAGRSRTRRALSARKAACARTAAASAFPPRWSRRRAERSCGAERYDRPLDDVFALQDEIALNVVGAIEPSLRRAEVERVKRKRPDSLDAYDLVLQAQPDVDSGMPTQVTQGAGASRTRARARSRLCAGAREMRRCAIIASSCAAGCMKRIGRRRSATLRRPSSHGRDDARAL